MIRDRHQIIIQHNYKEPSDESQYDGGDSISRTGIMAMCGSERDQLNMVSQYWKTNGEIVRHPNWILNINEYWGTYSWAHGHWRDQKEIAAALISRVESML